MSVSRALFLVDTPLQALNVREALLTYNIAAYDIMVCDCCRADAFEQTKKVIAGLHPDSVIEVPQVTGSVENRIEAYCRYLPELKEQDYQWVFFANVRQHWQRDIVCSLRQSQAVLLDDGNATLIFYDHLFLQNCVFDFPEDPDTNRAAIAASIRQRFGVDVRPPEHLEVFTIYELESLPWLSVKANRLSYLRHHHETVDDDRVVILGSGAAELNYISPADYAALLNQTAALYPDKHIIYQPHRITSKHILDVIRQHADFEIMRLSEPVEKWLANHPCPPSTIVSYFTTALTTCALCFPNLKVVSVETDLSRWSGAESSHVWNLTRCNNLQGLESMMAYMKIDPRVEVVSV